MYTAGFSAHSESNDKLSSMTVKVYDALCLPLSAQQSTVRTRVEGGMSSFSTEHQDRLETNSQVTCLHVQNISV